MHSGLSQVPVEGKDPGKAMGHKALQCCPPSPQAGPTPVQAVQAHFLMLWKACGEMTNVTPTCFSRVPQGQREPDARPHAPGKTGGPPCP